MLKSFSLFISVKSPITKITKVATNSIQVEFMYTTSSKLLKPNITSKTFKDPQLMSMSTSSDDQLFNSLKNNLQNEKNQNQSIINQEKIRNLQQWLEQSKYYGISIQHNISKEDFNILLDMGHFQRMSYLRYLASKRYAKEKNVYKKETVRQRKMQRKEELGEFQPNHMKYGLWSNTMFSKVEKSQLMNLSNHRLASATVNKLPTVIDLSFESEMKLKGINSLARQLLLSLVLNREDRNPLNLAFCNINFNSKTMVELEKRIPNICSLPMTLESKHYLDLYPKEKLIYLTPDAKQEMSVFDSESIYIIGGIIDCGVNLPLTLSRAKREKLKIQRFPLDRYVIFFFFFSPNYVQNNNKFI